MYKYITFISKTELFIEEFGKFKDYDAFYIALVTPFLRREEQSKVFICEQPFVMNKERQEKIKNIISPYTELNGSFRRVD